MKTLRTTVAMALGVAALASVRTASADEPLTGDVPREPVTTPAPPAPVQPAPAPQPAQVPAPIRQEPVQQVPQEPAPPLTSTGQPATSTTRTTQAQYVPPSDRVVERSIEKRPNATLLSTGVGLFVLSYGSSVIGGAISDRESDKKLFIPVAGPWMNLADRSCNASTPCGENEDVAKAMIVTSGVVQGAALLLALGSLVVPETTSVRERTKTATAPSVKVLPVSFVAGAGLGAVGRF